MEAFCWWLFIWFVCSDFLISRCRRGLFSSPFDPRYVAYISITLVTLPVVPSFGFPSPVVHHCSQMWSFRLKEHFSNFSQLFSVNKVNFPLLSTTWQRHFFQLGCKFKLAERFLEAGLISVISYSLGSKNYHHYRLSTYRSFWRSILMKTTLTSCVRLWITRKRNLEWKQNIWQS